MNVSLRVAEERDTKGLYKLARGNKITHFTGVHDAYEAPSSPDITVYTDDQSIEESVAVCCVP